MADIEQKMAALLDGLQPEVFEFQDDSHLHAGHAGNKGGGHYSITVVSSAFAGQSRLARQRSVHEALKPLFADGMIHALAVSAQTPDEFFN